MKVVQVLPDLQGGGVERGTLEVAAALVKAGHVSIVISAGGAMVEELNAQGSHHVTWDLGRKNPITFAEFLKLRQWLEQHKPDILHVRSRMPAWVCWLAWKSLPASSRPRLVTTVHGLYSVSRYSGIMCRGERVVAVSETVNEYILNNYPWIDQQRIRLIYRGVDPQQFPYNYQPDAEWLAAWYTAYPQTKGKKIITLPGRLTRLKGHNEFIDLLGQLKAQRNDVIGLIVGGEDPKRKAYAQSLKSRINDEGLNDTVILTGARNDIVNIYAISDLVLSLSTKPESFGRTVLESLRLGVPTFGYAHGGVAEILTAVYPQGLVPVADNTTLFDQVTKHLDDPVKPESSNLFTREEMLEKTLALYHELLKQD